MAPDLWVPAALRRPGLDHRHYDVEGEVAAFSVLEGAMRRRRGGKGDRRLLNGG
jgi:hypothetical protein